MPKTLEHLLDVVLAKEKKLSDKRGKEVRIFMGATFHEPLKFKLRKYQFLSHEDKGCLFMRDVFDANDHDKYCLKTVANGKSLFSPEDMFRPFYLVEDWIRTAMAYCLMPDFNHSEEELFETVKMVSLYCNDLWVDIN